MKHKAWWQQQSSLKNKKSNPTVTTAKAEVGRPFINKALPGVEEAARLLLLSLVTQGTSLPCRKAGITVVLWVNVLITPLSCNEHMLGGSKPVWGVPVCQKDPQQYLWIYMIYNKIHYNAQQLCFPCGDELMGPRIKVEKREQRRRKWAIISNLTQWNRLKLVQVCKV